VGQKSCTRFVGLTARIVAGGYSKEWAMFWHTALSRAKRPYDASNCRAHNKRQPADD
jgi:hypothetical protein